MSTATIDVEQTSDAPAVDAAPVVELPRDEPPARAGRKSRSGTSGAERRRRAKGEGTTASTSPDAAPKRAASGRTTTARKAPLAPRVEQLYTMLGLGVSFAPAPWAQPVGLAIGAQAADCAAAWDQLAKENPRVREALERLLTASAVGTLLAAHVPIILAAVGGKVSAGGIGGLVVPFPAPAGPVGDAPQA